MGKHNIFNFFKKEKKITISAPYNNNGERNLENISSSETSTEEINDCIKNFQFQPSEIGYINFLLITIDNIATKNGCLQFYFENFLENVKKINIGDYTNKTNPKISTTEPVSEEIDYNDIITKNNILKIIEEFPQKEYDEDVKKYGPEIAKDRLETKLKVYLLTVALSIYGNCIQGEEKRFIQGTGAVLENGAKNWETFKKAYEHSLPDSSSKKINH